MNFSDKDISEFLKLIDELLSSMEVSFKRLENGEALKSHYESIFDTLHSIRSAAGMLDLTPIQNLMKDIISEFEKIKDRPFLTAPEAKNFSKMLAPAKELLDQQEPTRSADLPLVYVIDDEAEIVDIISNILSSEKMEVLGFTKPQKALQSIKETLPQVVFTDYRMPEMNGLELLKEIKLISPNTQVIFVSAFLSKEDLVHAIKLGLYGVVEKPFQDSQILFMVINAHKKYRLWKLLQKSLHLILFQFSDIEDFLNRKGKTQSVRLLKAQMELILSAKREIETLGF